MVNNSSSERLEELLLLGSDISKSVDSCGGSLLNPEITMILGPTLHGFHIWCQRSLLKREMSGKNISHNSWSNSNKIAVFSFFIFPFHFVGNFFGD